MTIQLEDLKEALWEAFVTDQLAALLRRFAKAPGYDMLPRCPAEEFRSHALASWYGTSSRAGAAVHKLYVGSALLEEVANGTLYHKLLHVLQERHPEFPWPGRDVVVLRGTAQWEEHTELITRVLGPAAEGPAPGDMLLGAGWLVEANGDRELVVFRGPDGRWWSYAALTVADRWEESAGS